MSRKINGFNVEELSTEGRVTLYAEAYATCGEVSPFGESLAIGEGAVELMRLIMTTPPQAVDGRGRKVEESALPPPPYEGYVNPHCVNFLGELLDNEIG